MKNLKRILLIATLSLPVTANCVELALPFLITYEKAKSFKREVEETLMGYILSKAKAISEASEVPARRTEIIRGIYEGRILPYQVGFREEEPCLISEFRRLDSITPLPARMAFRVLRRRLAT